MMAPLQLYWSMILTNIQKLAALRPIVLASKSPRRKELLESLGLTFRCLPSSIDEQLLEGEEPNLYALRLAQAKAISISIGLTDEPSPIVIGSDTIVVYDNEILGKPNGKSDAVRILMKLSGERHIVTTSIALACGDSVLSSDHESTTVNFNEVTRNQIEEYVESGESMDKAGAYGIQGMGGFLVDRIGGNLDTVIGLPCLLLEKLAGEVLDYFEKSTD